MQTEVLDSLHEDRLHWFEKVLGTFEAVDANGRDGEGAAIADLLVDEGIGMRQHFQRVWHVHLAKAVPNRELPDHKERGEKILSLLERGESVIRRSAELARAYATASGHEVARLAQFEEQSRAFPIWLKECEALWDMLGRPFPPFDYEQINESRAEFERGEWEYVEEIIARLQNGGPLIKE